MYVFVKFKLEDATKASETNPSTVYVRRPGVTGNSTPRPASAPVEPTTDATVTVALRRPKSKDDKGNINYTHANTCQLFNFIF